jgi:acyl-CoA reductase-like NAD-dependent aldehyde dehydrogenase
MAGRLTKVAGHVVTSAGAGSTTNIAAEALVQEPEARVSTHSMLIGGELVQSSAGLSDPVINPATGEVFDYVPHGTRADLDRAVDAAAEAFKTWSTTPFEERGKCLLKFAELVEAQADALAEALTKEQGKPLANAMGEVRGLISSCKRYAKDGDLPSETVSEDDDAIYKIVYAPRGVIGGIAPWNFPISTVGGKILPSTITGNTCVIKPSPYTPLATAMLSEAAQKAFPAGVVNILTGGDELGQMIVEHPKVAQISFTGSAATGKKIMATGAGTLKKVTLELGGNDPAIVLPDVDIKDAAPKIFAGAMMNTGQVCVAIKRVFVHEDKYEEMLTALGAEAAKAKAAMNDGLVEGTQFGPINNKMQFARVSELVEDAKASGARVVAGGSKFSPNGKDGFFFEPTILGDVQEGVRVVDEEQFGPVVPVLKYSTVDEALARANDTDFGLGGSVWTNDVAKGNEIAAQIQSGVRGVNAHPGGGPGTTFGGIKQSGIGVEGGGKIGLKGFVDITSLRIAKKGLSK